jgi:hypothetical protein
MNSSGLSTKCVVPSRQAVFSFQHHLPRGVALHPLVSQTRSNCLTLSQ